MLADAPFQERRPCGISVMYSQAIGTGGGRVLLLVLVVIWKLHPVEREVPFRAVTYGCGCHSSMMDNW